MFYKFEKELREAVILDRPNRFIMEIMIDGKKQKAHCPSTGRIGNFDFKNTPCLVSESDNKSRKTKFTVEAISSQIAEKKNKKWIGINQGKSNAFIEFFLKNKFFADMIDNGWEVEREKKLGNSRIDFKVNNNFIEVKTFVGNIPYGSREPANGMITSLDRLIKHFSDLGEYAKQSGGKAIVLICNQYNAISFSPPENSEETEIAKTAKQAVNNGVENWQVNLKFTKKGVYFGEYFKLDLFGSDE